MGSSKGSLDAAAQILDAAAKCSRPPIEQLKKQQRLRHANTITAIHAYQSGYRPGYRPGYVWPCPVMAMQFSGARACLRATADVPGAASLSASRLVPLKPEETNALPDDIPAREMNAPAALEEITTDDISAHARTG